MNEILNFRRYLPKGSDITSPKITSSRPHRESNTDLRKFLDTSVPSISSHGSQAGTIYRAGKAGAQAMAQSERIKASSAANRFQAVSHTSMMSPRLRNTELASQWLRR